MNHFHKFSITTTLLLLFFLVGAVAQEYQRKAKTISLTSKSATNLVTGEVTLSQSSLNFGNKSTANTDSLSFWIRNSGDTSVTINDINTHDTVFTVRDTQFTVQSHDSARVWVYFYSKHNLSYQDVGVIKQTGTQGDLAISLSGTKQYPDTYYSSTQGLSAEALKTALRNLVINHTNRGYNTIRDKMFLEIDPVGGQLECVYTGRTIPVTTRDDMQTNGNFNTEHTWPQSTFSQQEPERADINHLFPTDETANSIRGNLPFDVVVSNVNWTVGGSKRGTNSNNITVFEPRDVHKGNLARGMFYFIIRYQNWGTFWTSNGVNQEAVFRTWNTQDPVSSEESSRNNEVAQASVQGKRNPFIDHPEFVDRISDFDGTATVTSSPRLVIDTRQINFGTTLQSDTTVFQLAVVNVGSASLSISSFTSSDSSFSISFPSTTIAADNYVYATVKFIPRNSNQSYSGTLVINSNDTQTGAITVNVSGNSITPYSGKISGNVFDDVNENGIKDGSDEGLENWSIYLSGVVSETTLTDVNGNYSFNYLQGGTYIVTEEEPIEWLRTFPPSGSYTISLSEDQDTTGFDFGNAMKKFTIVASAIGGGSITPSDTVSLAYGANQQFSITPNSGYQVDSVFVDESKVDSLESYTFTNVTAHHTITAYFSPIIHSISGMKFHDVNANGIFDGSDGSLENWSIVLSGSMSDTTLTDVNGNYSFINIPVGKYLVREIQQDGWIQSSTNPDSITISADTYVIGVNFGNTRFGSVSGFKFEDVDGDGVYDNDESKLHDWKIYLSNSNDTMMTLTDSTGMYSFDSLFAGTYRIWEEIRSSWIQTVAPTNPLIIESGSELVNQNFGNVFSIECIIVEKWNMISNPFLNAKSKVALFPTALTQAFKYNGGYVQEESLNVGNGYWLKFSLSDSTTLFGTEIGLDTIDVQADWNLIGSISYSLPVSCIQPIGTEIHSDFYEFESGYITSDVIEPCKAYWVKVSQAGKLVFNSGCAGLKSIKQKK